jgi:protein TonB
MARALILLRTPPDTLLDRIAQLAGHRRGFRLAVVGAACAHAGLVSVLGDARPQSPRPWTNAVSELMIELPEPESPPIPSPPEPPRAPDTARSRAPAARHEHPAPAAPQPARAAAVLTQSEDNEQPVDFTDSIVVGAATTYAGGITQADGTSARAVRAAGNSRATKSTTPSSGNTASGTGPDFSRMPAVLGGSAWSCPFPPEADADSVNHAQVAIRVEVDANGRTTRVLVLSDPGHGFAAAARACALGQRWTPGADRSGRPTSSGINLNVRFVR